jgi:hypothetical protein
MGTRMNMNNRSDSPIPCAANSSIETEQHQVCSSYELYSNIGSLSSCLFIHSVGTSRFRTSSAQTQDHRSAGEQVPAEYQIQLSYVSFSAEQRSMSDLGAYADVSVAQ